jgi:hypothetical protein
VPMDFLSTGIRELARRLRRRSLRRSLKVEGKRLQGAEIELGREGWRELANSTDLPAELTLLLAPLRQIDLAGADKRAKLAEIEGEIAALREREAAARWKLDEEITQLDRDRAPLRKKRDELSAAGPVAPAAGDEAPHRNLLQEMQELDQKEVELRERRRKVEQDTALQLETLREKLNPLQLAQDEMDQQRREPLALLGRYLASNDQNVPPAATRQLAALRQRRTQLVSLERREVALANESRQTDPQSVRLSIFVLTTFAVIAALALLLIFRAPPRRDWLPANTQLLVSANISRLVSSGAPQAGNPWNPIWAASIRPLREVPTLANPAADVRRVVRALGVTPPADLVEYNLVETYSSAGAVLSPLPVKHGFGLRYDSVNLGGLPIYERSTMLACAQIGPETLAVGTTAAVEQMIRVRLGLSRDLRLDEKFFEKFQRLDRGSMYRVATQQPEAMIDASAAPLFLPELLRATKLFGFAVRSAEPMSVTFLVRAESPAAATQVSAMLRERGAALLRLEGAGFVETPVLEQNDTEVEFRCVLSDVAAREFLTRISGVTLATGEGSSK